MVRPIYIIPKRKQRWKTPSMVEASVSLLILVFLTLMIVKIMNLSGLSSLSSNEILIKNTASEEVNFDKEGVITFMKQREEIKNTLNEEVNFGMENVIKPMKAKEKKCTGCRFDQSPPTLHEDKSFVISLDDGKNTVVTPMTVTYNYELYNGQFIYTNPEYEKIPNADFDYAILAINELRNINRETNQHVSLDEVYFHHFGFMPFHVPGAETLTRNESMPFMKFPTGYGVHVIYDKMPNILVNSILVSNKDLAPIDGSIAKARKECNECYYSPGNGKGFKCTPKTSGFIKCCGNSPECLDGSKICTCPTKEKSSTPTKYQIQVDVLISRDVNKFKPIDQLALMRTSCQVNLKSAHGNFCYQDSMCFEDLSVLVDHHVPLQQYNDDPYVLTCSRYVAPSSGKLVWAQSHLHTGAVNATLRINGNIICSAGTTYGSNMDESINVRNEKNHLIHVGSCYDTAIYKNGGVNFNSGDVFTSESVYNGGINDDRLVGYDAAGGHLNSMTHFYLGIAFDDQTDIKNGYPFLFSPLLYFKGFTKYKNKTK